MTDVTRILSAIDQGGAQAAEQLLPLVYDELHRLGLYVGLGLFSVAFLDSTRSLGKSDYVVPSPFNRKENVIRHLLPLTCIVCSALMHASAVSADDDSDMKKVIPSDFAIVAALHSFS
jgi:hypothetical protein